MASVCLLTSVRLESDNPERNGGTPISFLSYWIASFTSWPISPNLAIPDHGYESGRVWKRTSLPSIAGPETHIQLCKNTFLRLVRNFFLRFESIYQRDNLIKTTNGNLSRQTPRSQTGSLIVEGSVWGRRRMGNTRPTQRHIVTGNVSKDRTWHSTLGDLTKVKKKRVK